MFSVLNLGQGDVFLDIGCGTGDYSLHAAREMGGTGHVYATDIREELIESLMERAKAAGLDNLTAIVCDIRDSLPFENNCIDVCFVSTVLHSLDIKTSGPVLFREIKRVLKPNGRFIIIKCNTEDTRFGPPLHMRIDFNEMERIITPHGFKKTEHVDLGYNYLLSFTIGNIS